MGCVGGEVRDQVGEGALRPNQQGAGDSTTTSRTPEAGGRVLGEGAEGEGGQSEQQDGGEDLHQEGVRRLSVQEAVHSG